MLSLTSNTSFNPCQHFRLCHTSIRANYINTCISTHHLKNCTRRKQQATAPRTSDLNSVRLTKRITSTRKLLRWKNDNNSCTAAITDSDIGPGGWIVGQSWLQGKYVDHDETTDSCLATQTAVINETMRIFPVIPGVLPRVVPSGGFKAGQYWLPEGVRLFAELPPPS